MCLMRSSCNLIAQDGTEFFDRADDGSLLYDPTDPDDPEVMTVEVDMADDGLDTDDEGEGTSGCFSPINTSQ